MSRRNFKNSVFPGLKGIFLKIGCIPMCIYVSYVPMCLRLFVFLHLRIVTCVPALV